MTYLKWKGLVQHGTYHHFGRGEKRKILKILKYNYSCKKMICSIYKIYAIFQQSRFLSTLQHLKRCIFYMATPLRPRVAQIVKCLWLCRANCGYVQYTEAYDWSTLLWFLLTEPAVNEGQMVGYRKVYTILSLISLTNIHIGDNDDQETR